MSGEIVVGIIGALAVVAVGILSLRGVRETIRASRAASDSTSAQQAQAQALDAWRELVDPLRRELGVVRQELNTERQARQEETAETRRRMSLQAQQIAHLRQEVHTWKRLAKTIARWATTLRDQVLQLGGTLPATPEELLTLQALEDAGHLDDDDDLLVHEPDTEL